MIKMNLKNITESFKKLEMSQQKLTKDEARKIVKNLVNDLKENTPVDTGFARDSWAYTELQKNFNIENNAKYIQYLNEGSSKQAPAFFIETIALKYGKPIGTIVQVKGD